MMPEDRIIVWLDGLRGSLLFYPALCLVMVGTVLMLPFIFVHVLVKKLLPSGRRKR